MRFVIRQVAERGSEHGNLTRRAKLYRFRCTCPMKPIAWLGSSRSDLRDFPEDARTDAGYQLERVQRGEEADDWKPMKTAGPGVREVRGREASGACRVIY